MSGTIKRRSFVAAAPAGLLPARAQSGPDAVRHGLKGPERLPDEVDHEQGLRR